MRDYFNRKNAIIAFEKNVSTMKMAGKQLFITIFFFKFLIIFFFEGKEFYRQFSRISEEGFLFILGKISPYLKKKSIRESITADERLAVTLKFLSTGNSYISLSESFPISKSSIVNIVPEVCAVLWNQFKFLIKVFAC